MLRQQLLSIGFKEIPHFTIGNNLNYDLGRFRQLSLSSIETPCEMMFITQIDDENPKKITDLVVLHNYDYDGYLTFEKVESLINLLAPKEWILSQKTTAQQLSQSHQSPEEPQL